MGAKAEQLKEAIDKFACDELKSEIDHAQFHVSEDEVSQAEAFVDACGFAERHDDRKLIRQCRNIEIVMGVLREVSDEEYENTGALGSKADLFVQHNKKRYGVGKTYQQLIDECEA